VSGPVRLPHHVRPVRPKCSRSGRIHAPNVWLHSLPRGRMATIRILPLDVELGSGDDATIMGAAQALGYYWPTTCNGEARCTTCACEVIEGAALLTAMG